jgi:hypothetical protein
MYYKMSLFYNKIFKISLVSLIYTMKINPYSSFIRSHIFTGHKKYCLTIPRGAFFSFSLK